MSETTKPIWKPSKAVALALREVTMPVHILLAHGALGNWDEVIFVSVAAVFLFMMGLSWVRSRANTPEEPQTPAATAAPAEPDSPDHFTLN